MQTANCRVTIDDKGSDVPKRGVTPAEVQILIHQFHVIAGKLPVLDLKITGTSLRTSGEEMQRLREKYKNKLVNEMFPGVNPVFPETFAEIQFQGQYPYDPKKGAPIVSFQPMSQEVAKVPDGGTPPPPSIPNLPSLPAKVTLPPTGQSTDPLMAKPVAVVAAPSPTPLATNGPVPVHESIAPVVASAPVLSSTPAK